MCSENQSRVAIQWRLWPARERGQKARFTHPQAKLPTSNATIVRYHLKNTYTLYSSRSMSAVVLDPRRIWCDLVFSETLFWPRQQVADSALVQSLASSYGRSTYTPTCSSVGSAMLHAMLLRSHLISPRFRATRFDVLSPG